MGFFFLWYPAASAYSSSCCRCLPSTSRTEHHTLNITHPKSHTQQHSLNITHSTSQTRHHTHSTSHTQHHTPHITHPTSNTFNITQSTSHTPNITHSTPYILNITHPTSHTQHHTPNITHPKKHTLNITHSTSHTQHPNITHSTSLTQQHTPNITHPKTICQIEGQNLAQIECQNLCQIECQHLRQQELQNLCQIECQHLCQIECQNPPTHCEAVARRGVLWLLCLFFGFLFSAEFWQRCCAAPPPPPAPPPLLPFVISGFFFWFISFSFPTFSHGRFSLLWYVEPPRPMFPRLAQPRRTSIFTCLAKLLLLALPRFDESRLPTPLALVISAIFFWFFSVSFPFRRFLAFFSFTLPHLAVEGLAQFILNGYSS